MISLILTLVIGVCVGYIAGKLTKSSSNSMLIDCVIGIAGGFIGRFLFGLIGFANTNMIGYLISSIVGAVVLICIINAVKKK